MYNKFVFSLFLLLISCGNTQQADSAPSNKAGTEHYLQTETDSTTWIAKNRYITGQKYLSVSTPKITPRKGWINLIFDISWDASWHDHENYDAAWIFVKGKTKEGLWEHIRVQSNQYDLLTNKTIDKAKPAFELPDDRMGIYVYRATPGEGNNHWTIQLGLEQTVNKQYTEYRVFGLEMVYIPEGPFELGTLKSIGERSEVLTPGAGGAPYNPFFTYKEKTRGNYGGVFKVASEAVIPIGKANGNLFWIDANIPGTNTFSGIPEGELGINYPKGYNGFYQMKYELSQQQYCDFLNTLSPKQQATRDFSEQLEYKRPIKDYRNAIQNNEGVYSTNRPNRPCNFISWLDGQAYADWAGLRHMTELEFEKACRGPLPAVYREYVWGVSEIRDKKNMVYCNNIYDAAGQLAKEETGQETTDGNIHASMFSYFNIDDVCKPGSRFYDPDCAGCRSFKGGDGGRGPMRSGICGVNTEGDRVKAGATYYGAMDMGGNLQEPVVTVGHPSGRKFAGSHGDGRLSAEGFADNADWQPIDNDYAFAGRGGCWKFHENHARTADRFKGLRKRENRRASHIGFRGVRTKK